MIKFKRKTIIYILILTAFKIAIFFLIGTKSFSRSQGERKENQTFTLMQDQPVLYPVSFCRYYVMTFVTGDRYTKL